MIMIYEILNDAGNVVNRIVAEAEFVESVYPGRYRLAADQPVESTVPQSVSMRQARLALLGAGKLGLVQPAIDAMPEPQRSAASIEWGYASSVDRQHDFTLALAAAIGLDDVAMDALFIQAATL